METSNTLGRLVAVVIALVVGLRLGGWGVSLARRWWHDRTPEPAVCAQLIEDVDHIRAVLREGLELFHSDAPREKLEQIVAREEDASVIFSRTLQLAGNSCHVATRRELEERLKKMKLERDELHDTQKAYLEQQER